MLLKCYGVSLLIEISMMYNKKAYETELACPLTKWFHFVAFILHI